VSSGLPVVAIVGRPNVGKSTLFNRILGQRRAIVGDQPGVTRDRNFALADWTGRDFFVVDTGGLEPDVNEPMPAAVRKQVEAAIAECDVLVFVVDGKLGPHPMDARVAELLRKSSKPVVLAVNKLDGLPNVVDQHDFWELGLGEPIPVSALTGKGSGDLLDIIIGNFADGDAVADQEGALSVAVIGKPNVGKSSFINRLLGQDRLVVSEVPGTTRDSIDTPMKYHGRTIVFVDTAGLRRQARIDPGLEYYSALRTERTIGRADVCLLLIDATEPVHIQDLRIAEKAWRSGCALVIAANKWDLVERETMTAVEYERALKARAPSLESVPIVFTSALTGQRVQRMLDVLIEVAANRERRIPTRAVNEAIAELAARVSPPHHRGMPVRFLYATQAASAPPTFVVFANYPNAVPDHYVRYLRKGLRARWNFAGSPVRLRLRARSETRTT
jgi:GTP-binding protein